MLLLTTLALVACQDEPAADAPPGLDPLEENTADLPDDETVNLVSTETDDYNQTHARGRVDVAVADVIACLQNPDVGVDRRRVAEYTVTEDVDPDYTVSYDVITTIHDTVTLTYTLPWLQGDRGDGTWGARWEKAEDRDTDVNAYLVSLLQGSVLLQPIEGDEGHTDVGIIERLEAPFTSTDDTEQYTSDFYASILACSHDVSLPTYCDDC